MLAADARAMLTHGERAQFLADTIKELDSMTAQQVAAPQARELTDEQIMDASNDFVRDALGKTNLLLFARAVLAARSEP